ncbi:MAG: PACE efflux transporter [Burkholderiaceae bacterium]
MQGIQRKIVYVSLFELFAIAISTAGFVQFSSASLGHAGVAAVVSSAVAVMWNLVYNTVFEAWEARQTVRGRNWRRRAIHAVGFEIGLTLALVPFFAWWLDIGLWQAFVLDIGLIVFFLVYNIVFTWLFDQAFGLPASAR